MCSQYAVLKRVAQKWVPPRRKGSRFKTELTRRIRHFQQRLLNLVSLEFRCVEVFPPRKLGFSSQDPATAESFVTVPFIIFPPSSQYMRKRCTRRGKTV
ncbi:hypothetical protein MGG_15999 [Pyricularia oryzae 70-15]|uniref:Uncharacterized protein n=1 Tax=Pyricularia oryzae (strain 70-15 / ATCC MYA-4617 / FGSC 8958) TaxID=242507 RepID=G4MMS4_PYRO7|nr:uncharacterized protein MGG_15999 [Pyricularia oryzae 70-15]EHA56154.1 hypothetical protein MGG_15999 [Pyricularia oryzae 70-15]